MLPTTIVSVELLAEGDAEYDRLAPSGKHLSHNLTGDSPIQWKLHYGKTVPECEKREFVVWEGGKELSSKLKLTGGLGFSAQLTRDKKGNYFSHLVHQDCI